MKPPAAVQLEDLPAEVQEALESVSFPGQDDDYCIEVLQNVAKNYPGYAIARLNLAAMQLRIGDTDGARSTYTSMLADFPEVPGATAGLATVLAARKEYAEAEKLARQAIAAGYIWSPCYTVIAESRAAANDQHAASDAYLTAYLLSPHSWQNLQEYCRLTNRPYNSPIDSRLDSYTYDQVVDLSVFIDKSGHTPGPDGVIPGCDHTFRFTDQWADQNGIDRIALYQFLNSRGGFCDCEVCINVEGSMESESV